MSSRPPARSSSVGALPREKKHFTSRVESTGTISLDVRCACQFYESDSLLPERINPIGSRPESRLSGHENIDPNLTTQNTTASGQLTSRPGMQYNHIPAGKQNEIHPNHSQADRISIRSFGSQQRRSFDQITSNIKSDFDHDQFTRRGLIVKSISDATDEDQIHMSREASQERHSRGRDFDTISNRSIGLRRISRTPSKTDLYVADIYIPGTVRIMSKINIPQIPQLNVTAPTPTPIENRDSFSVLEEFRKNRAASEKLDTNVQDTTQQTDELKLFERQVEEHRKRIQQQQLIEQEQRQRRELQQIEEKKRLQEQQQMELEQQKQRELQQIEERKRLQQQQEIEREQQQQRELQRIEEEKRLQRQQLIEQEERERRELQQQQQRQQQQEMQKRLQQQIEFEKQKQIEEHTNSETYHPQLLKRHHPPEEESPPMKSEKEPKQHPIREKSPKPQLDFEKLIPGPIARRLSFRSSDQIPQIKSDKNIQRYSPQREKSPKHQLDFEKLLPGAISRRLSFKSSDAEPMEFVVQSAISVMEAPQRVQEKPSLNPTASSVTETFSLKVDEMDQYASKPVQFKKSSSVDRTRESHSPFMMRSVTPIPPSSQSKMNQSQIYKNDSGSIQSRISRSMGGSQSQIFKGSQQEITKNASIIGHSSEIDRPLVSVPINISRPTLTPQDSSEGATNLGYFDSSRDAINSNSPSFHNVRQRTPSESGSQKTLDQKLMQSKLLRRKQYVDRTQSQDRAGRESSLDTQSVRMMKTVSFDFTRDNDIREHTSRLGAYERQTSLLTKDKRDWLDRTYFMRDHEYEPIGQPSDDKSQSQPSPEKEPTTKPAIQQEQQQSIPTVHVTEPMDIDNERITTTVQKERPFENESAQKTAEAEEFQRDVEERYFSSATTTPRTESRTDYIHTSQVDTSALEELPLKAENRRKSFMANAQDKSRKVQANLRSQAVKIQTKIRGIKKPPTNGSPRKERKRFKAPEFTKMKMPDVKFKGPDMSKFKTPEFKKIEFKRPDFTKFNKPDMSKFKVQMPERFASTFRPRKEKLVTELTVETVSITTPESSNAQSPKKLFDFGTYPRVLRRKKEKSLTTIVRNADNNIPSSSETPPSFESATFPRVKRDAGPVGSKWTDKFSEISYGDSESGKYQRYESSEPESIEPRESSLERKIRENLDRVAKEDAEFDEFQTQEQREFAEFDEENRAIHEISKIRENEFKQRKPIVHQDSDLVSEESKEIGWSEKDILRNKLLHQTDVNESSDFPSEERLTGSVTNTNLETQSTGSRQKGVIEEIDDDEFFLRKRGISQDNIEIRQYISSAIREGFETPINALEKLGHSSESYPDEMVISNEKVNLNEYITSQQQSLPPPTTPKRLKRISKYDSNVTDSVEVSQEFDIDHKENYIDEDNISLPQSGSDYYNKLPPNRPLRRSKKQYSEDSQEVPYDGEEIPYFDDEELFYKNTIKEDMNNLGQKTQQYFDKDENEIIKQINIEPPKAPKRRKKQFRDSVEKDSYLNGFAGRSISNSSIQNEDQDEEAQVFRTEHQYTVPLAESEQFTVTSTTPRLTRSRSRVTDDDRTSRGADSIIFNEEEHFKIEMKENNGYAVVKKEPPPRPPPPIRRKRTFNSFDQRFATMPHITKYSPVPQRPKRNYSTIGPARPPRRKSSGSLRDTILLNTSDTTQYEELDVDIEDFERMETPKNLQSGDVINKMKDRPLPPPPRPPREYKKRRNEYNDDEDDLDGNGDKIIADFQENSDYEIDKQIDKCIEVEASTQTDPLPDDYVCEEFEITDDMKIIEPRRPKTLEDILKEEQEAELERAKQLADEENLTRSLQKFRESNQRSLSEKSRGSTADRSKTVSRPTTPSAIIIERRIPTPLPYFDQTVVEASLIVQPVDDNEIVEKIESEPTMSDIKSERSGEMSEMDVEDKHENEQAVISDTEYHLQREENRLRERLLHQLNLLDEQAKKLSDTKAELEFERQIEEKQRTQSDTQEELISESEQSPPPQPPPRRRSSSGLSTEQTIKTESVATVSNQLLPIHEVSSTPTQALAPNRLAVTDLEVERLSVHALQAAQITVSQLQGSLISADDLDCKSGNLIVRNLELPPGLIEQIVERVRSSDRTNAQAQTQTTESEEKKSLPQSAEEPPARPPPPPLYPSPEYMPYSIPPQSFYQLHPPTDDDIQPIQSQRRRRHHRRRDSSSDEEDSYRERRRSRQSTRSPEPTIGELGGQLLNACGTSVTRTMNQILNYLRAAEKEGSTRSNTSTAIVILILATLAFLIFGISGRSVHHHHWDFFNLPGNDGREK